MTQKVIQKMLKKVSKKMTKKVSKKMSKKVSKKMSKKVSKKCPKNVQKKMGAKAQQNSPLEWLGNGAFWAGLAIPERAGVGRPEKTPETDPLEKGAMWWPPRSEHFQLKPKIGLILKPKMGLQVGI